MSLAFLSRKSLRTLTFLAVCLAAPFHNNKTPIVLAQCVLKCVSFVSRCEDENGNILIIFVIATTSYVI